MIRLAIAANAAIGLVWLRQQILALIEVTWRAMEQ